MKKLLGLLLIFAMLSGCVNTSSAPKTPPSSPGNPTAKDMLKNADADFFILDSIVYSNATNVEWVLDEEYVLGEQVGEITKIANQAIHFTHGTANQLPVGTKIYKTNSPVYIAVVKDEEIPYIPLIEG